MATKIPILSITRPFNRYPMRDFWFENVASGNTAYDACMWVKKLDREKL
jgi:hypothetical protein